MHKEFEVHLLNDKGIGRAKTVAADFDNLLTNLEVYIPQGREFSIVKTKLEEAAFFAKKAIANDKINQQ
jgi:hypothetical protein